MKLVVLPELLAVCRLEPGSTIPAWAQSGGFVSITRTQEELSIVCAERSVPAEVQAQRGFLALKVQGPLDFSLSGILSQLLEPLAEARISVFTISTFDTDYVLVREARLDETARVLRATGHILE